MLPPTAKEGNTLLHPLMEPNRHLAVLLYWVAGVVSTLWHAFVPWIVCVRLVSTHQHYLGEFHMLYNTHSWNVNSLHITCMSMCASCIQDRGYWGLGFVPQISCVKDMLHTSTLWYILHPSVKYGCSSNPLLLVHVSWAVYSSSLTHTIPSHSHIVTQSYHHSHRYNSYTITHSYHLSHTNL